MAHSKRPSRLSLPTDQQIQQTGASSEPASVTSDTISSATLSSVTISSGTLSRTMSSSTISPTAPTAIGTSHESTSTAQAQNKTQDQVQDQTQGSRVSRVDLSSTSYALGVLATVAAEATTPLTNSNITTTTGQSSTADGTSATADPSSTSANAVAEEPTVAPSTIPDDPSCAPSRSRAWNDRRAASTTRLPGDLDAWMPKKEFDAKMKRGHTRATLAKTAVARKLEAAKER